MTSDREIHEQISSLVTEEHELRESLAAGDITPGEEHERLRQVETQLDQCWDLLRQRQARRDAGQDPEGAAVRPAGEVENYLG